MKKPKTPNIVIVGIITVITIVLWIIFGVYKIISTPQDVDVPNEVLSTVDPSLNEDALSSLEQRIFFTEGQLGNISIISTPEPEEEVTPEPEPEEEEEVATQSAETEEETATESGEVADEEE